MSKANAEIFNDDSVIVLSLVLVMVVLAFGILGRMPRVVCHWWGSDSDENRNTDNAAERDVEDAEAVTEYRIMD